MSNVVGKSSPLFWERIGASRPYSQERQTGSTCVFISVAAALNHLVGRNVWTELTLVDEFKRQGMTNVDFGSVMQCAFSPVADEIEFNNHLDSPQQPAPTKDQLAAWVDGGGIVIVSLEKQLPTLSGMCRCGVWHMFTLVATDGDYFQVWDTNGRGGFVHSDELESGIEYGGGVRYVVHDKHNMLFLRRKHL